MKIKTSELSGEALHFAVAIAEGWQDFEEEDEGFSWHRGKGSAWLTLETFRPSELWEQGGPIIEREEIGLKRNLPCSKGREWEAQPSISAKGAGGRWAYGTTPLIAAMRGYIASKLGYEVDIPDSIAGG